MGNAGEKGEGSVEPNGPGRPVKGTQAGLFGEEGHTPEPKKLIKGQYPFDEVASAFQKEIRRGDVRAAMYWGHLLYGEAPYYAWKRLLVAAAEDIGLGAPEVVEKVCGLALAWRICREKSYYVSPHHFSMAVMLLCAAPKDNRVEDLQTLTQLLIKQSERRSIPAYAKDGHTAAGKARGATWDEWYRFRHDEAGIPVNAYTLELAQLMQEWFNEVRAVEAARRDRERATEFCTRYVAGQGRHRLQARCPLAPEVACSPEEGDDEP